jgi:hypothetical protein
VCSENAERDHGEKEEILRALRDSVVREHLCRVL